MPDASQPTQPSHPLEPLERATLLKLARQALQDGVKGRPRTRLNLDALPPRLRQPGTTFVTLTIGGELRGCVGGLEVSLPLAEDVRTHAVAAALEDYRFPPVRPAELRSISIEISRLTQPQPLEYDRPEELPARLRPGLDGVVLVDGLRRATFLPQVWEKVPEPEIFLSMLCRKMGAASDLWRSKKLAVLTYQVEEFHE